MLDPLAATSDSRPRVGLTDGRVRNVAGGAAQVGDATQTAAMLFVPRRGLSAP